MLHIKHVELKTANEFVNKYHRSVTGHKFSLGCLVGIVIVGRTKNDSTPIISKKLCECILNGG